MTQCHPYDWFQAKGASAEAKFHAAVWRQTGPGTNYKPFALCSNPGGNVRLDRAREFDDPTPDRRLCRICRYKIRQQAEENTVTTIDPQDGPTNYDSDDYPVGHPAARQQAPVGSRRYAAERRAERHEREAERAREELARLETLPEEPEVEDGEPNVIWFRKVFQNGSIPYEYAACKGTDGLWYTTGPSSTRGYSWQSLVEWIYEGDSADLWFVVDLEAAE